MTDELRTPLTLEFSPEPMEGDEYSEPTLIAEPSFQHDGRIFVAVHPFGRRVGLHLLPHDAQRLRDHLSKLLLDPLEASESGRKAEPLPQAPPPNWNARIEAAVRRSRRKIKLPAAHFRLEFQLGRLVIVVGTTQDA